MTVTEAVRRVKKLIPNQNVTAVFNYDFSHYLIVAPRSGVKVDRNDPLYLLDKSTGMMTDYRPTADLSHFRQIIQNGHNLLKGR